MIPEELFDAYATAIDANAELAKRAVLKLDAELAGLSGRALEAALAEKYAAIVAEFGGYVAACAVEFYAEMRAAADVGTRYTPQVYEPDNGGLLAWDAREALRASADFQAALNKLSGAAVQRSMEYADETMLQNMLLDDAKPRWALVPHAGACDWCRMLGSAGFRYRSEATANASRHPNCRCRPVVDFDAKNPGLRGYDPDKLLEEYRENHPEWAKRTGKKGGKTAAKPGGCRFGGYADIAAYLDGATSMEDLRARAEKATSAALSLGFKRGSSQWNGLVAHVNELRKRL